jgi:hypothetical protein
VWKKADIAGVGAEFRHSAEISTNRSQYGRNVVNALGRFGL